MKDSDDTELFMSLLEAALLSNNIPEDQWKNKLHSQLSMKAKLKIHSVMQDNNSTYKDIKDALLGCTAMSFSSAAEDFCTGERGRLTNLEPRQAIEKMARLAGKIMKEAVDITQALNLIAVAQTRSWLVPPLKTFIDMSQTFGLQEYISKIEEWEKSQPVGTACFKKTYPGHQLTSTFNKPHPYKKPITCFYCGKTGHVSRECRSRLAEERQVTTTTSQKPNTQTETLSQTQTFNPAVVKTEKRQVTCFTCHQKGHKSHQCPQKVSQVRRVQILSNKVVALKDNELFGSVGDHSIPVTCDSGADITVVPEECVSAEQFTGVMCEVDSFNKVRSTGKKCNITVTIAGRDFLREAVTQPGRDLAWTVCLSVPYSSKEEREFISGQMDEKFAMQEEDTCYLPAEMEGGILKSGIMVRDGTLISAPADTNMGSVQPDYHIVDNPGTESSEGVVTVAQENELRENGEVTLVVGVEQPSVLVEESGDQSSGSAAGEGEDVVLYEGITSEVPRPKLVLETESDSSLATARSLAESHTEGYHYKDGLVFRTRLDKLGDAREQMCLPQPYRSKCLKMAHDNFGHQGRNKMVDLIRPFFYWPTITVDCLSHIKSCLVCQKMDKRVPKKATMQERELVSVPAERIAIDLVGLFPTATGGFKYLLTCIDLATRWPEAIPLRTTMSKVIITQLTTIFSRCGFPTAIVSDNGPQFTGKGFQKWLRDKGIRHIRSSPYHTQGNGVVERLHRTLNGIIGRTVEKKGNWAAVVPMALYFIHCSPCNATGMSPFMARQGWEPATPVQLLYKAWAQTDLGDINLDEWITCNAERVQALRDKATVSKQSASQKTKETWDAKAQDRTFTKSDQVLMRKPGINLKLAESWEGPYTVVKRNSPLSYGIDTGDRNIPSMHVQLLKQFREHLDCPKVARVTSVFEPDTDTDGILDRYAEVNVVGDELQGKQAADVKLWELKHHETMTKQPGLTHLVRFSINTGDHPPIYQRAYSTPVALRASIDTEIDWLLYKEFIRPSTSPWASPMVTVKKPDGSARLCVDFKAINLVTQQEPFYMPRVEEVLESVGKARYISKIDLSKGYYQIPMVEEDICKTAFTCHRGRFEFLRMPFGVKNATAVFQVLMQSIFRDDISFCSPYMDDIIIFSPSWEEHVIHVDNVLTKLKAAGLTANPAKCKWGGRSMEFLGHLVGEGKMSVPAHRAEALGKYNKPVTKRGLRAFLGSVGFHRRYVELLAKHTAILTPLRRSRLRRR